MKELELEECNYEELVTNIIRMRIEYLSTPEGMKAEVMRVFSALTDDQKMQVLQIMQDLMKKSDRE